MLIQRGRKKPVREVLLSIYREMIKKEKGRVKMQSINFQLNAAEALVFRGYKMYKTNVLQNNQNVPETHTV